MAKRLAVDHCCGVIIDVQEFFLSQLDKPHRSKIETHTKSFAGLLGYLRIPLVITLERPVEQKGTSPRSDQPAPARQRFGADVREGFFRPDQRKEDMRITSRPSSKTQVIVAGCETDVCVLQSCLGLRSLGYEVYVVEELLFSSSPNVGAAIARMQAEGAIFLSLQEPLLRAVRGGGGSRHFEKIVERFGPFPDDLSEPTGQ